MIPLILAKSRTKKPTPNPYFDVVKVILMSNSKVTRDTLVNIPNPFPMEEPFTALSNIYAQLNTSKMTIIDEIKLFFDSKNANPFVNELRQPQLIHLRDLLRSQKKELYQVNQLTFFF